MEDKTMVVGSRIYVLDELGCLMDFNSWQPEFAEALAEEMGIATPLTEQHNKIIGYLRESVVKTGRTPIVHRTCRDNGLKLRDLEQLFPAGYHRGACRIAGLNYHERYEQADARVDKIYRINARGFLVDAGEWDEPFAHMRAEELGVDLTDRHWEVIRFLRRSHADEGVLPTLFQVCRGCDIEGDEFERLFPRGYHRSAVKIAGLTLTPG